MTESLRLDRFLTQCGVCSRKEAVQIIKSGIISVDGSVITSSDYKLRTDSIVTKNGERLLYEKFVYYVLNKPAGVITATKDSSCKTVLDILDVPKKKELSPVGRLDKDTEGLLLITNDGKLNHELMSPRKHVSKTYFVLADTKLTGVNLEQITNGIDIGDDTPCLPANISYLGDNDGAFSYELTVYEGRFHQVKRMFQACNSNVVFLRRIAIGQYLLPENLDPGEYVKITLSDIELMRENNNADRN